MREPLRPRTSVVVLALGLGLLLRLWFIAHQLAVDGDSLLYGDLAKNLLQHGVYGFSQDGGTPVPTLIRLPGYPLFLAACFRVFGVEHYNAVLGVQCTVDLLSCVLLGATSARAFRSQAAGEAALLLAALCPLTANYVAAPLTETLTLACMVLAFYALQRWLAAPSAWNRWLAVLTLAMAASVLLRPEQGLLAGALLPVMVWVSLRMRGETLGKALVPAAVCVLGVCAVMAPWAVRNARTFHVFEPLAPKSAVDPGEPVPRGFNAWFRSWGIDFASTEDVYWNYDGNTIDLDDLPARVGDTPQQLAATQALIQKYNETAKPTPAIDAAFAELARERREASLPRYYVGLPLARLLNMLFRPRTELTAVPLDWWRYRAHPRWTLIALGLGAVNLLYTAAGVSGAVRWWRLHRRPAERVLLWAGVLFVLLRCALLLTLDNSEPRYTLEFFPLWILAASSFLAPRNRAARQAATARHGKAFRERREI